MTASKIRQFLRLQTRFHADWLANRTLFRALRRWHKAENTEKPMRLILAFILLTSAVATTGCVPVVAGAAGAIAADTIAEDRGRDLF